MARSTQSLDLAHDPYAGAIDPATLYGGLPPIEPIPSLEFKDKLEFEKFMQDQLVISIHSTGDPNEPTLVFVGSNNKKCWLAREVKTKLSREMVATLAQSHQRNFKTSQVADPEAIEGTKVETRSVQGYPFEVLYDPNPRGREWLSRFMRSCA